MGPSQEKVHPLPVGGAHASLVIVSLSSWELRRQPGRRAPRSRLPRLLAHQHRLKVSERRSLKDCCVGEASRNGRRRHHARQPAVVLHEEASDVRHCVWLGGWWGWRARTVSTNEYGAAAAKWTACSGGGDPTTAMPLLLEGRKLGVRMNGVGCSQMTAAFFLADLQDRAALHIHAGAHSTTHQKVGGPQIRLPSTSGRACRLVTPRMQVAALHKTGHGRHHHRRYHHYSTSSSSAEHTMAVTTWSPSSSLTRRGPLAVRE